MKKHLITALAIAGGSGLMLSACTDTGNDADSTLTVSETTATTSTTATTATTATTVAEDPLVGEDPIFEVLADVLAEHPEGIVVQVDRDGSSRAYDVEVVAGDELIKIEVTDTGALNEKSRQNDGEMITRAQDATVTASAAIRQALDAHQDALLDEAELDDDNGTLQWKIELDDADRNDVASLVYPAN